MSGDKPTIYWDTSVFLAWLKNEKRNKPGVMAGVEACVVEIDSGRWNLITSTITRTEVLESKTGPEVRKRFLDLFKRPNIIAVNVDPRIADLASEIRNYYIVTGERRRLSTPDALHLATAIVYDAEEFHTLDDGKSDDKSLGLLELNGNVGGHRLIVVLPGTKQQRIDFGTPEDKESVPVVPSAEEPERQMEPAGDPALDVAASQSASERSSDRAVAETPPPQDSSVN